MKQHHYPIPMVRPVPGPRHQQHPLFCGGGLRAGLKEADRITFGSGATGVGSRWPVA